MRKEELKQLAMLGIAGGMLFSAADAESAGYSQRDAYAKHGCGGGGCGGSNDDGQGEGTPPEANHNQSAFYSPEGEISEQGLLSQLSEESKKVYKGLDESEKQLVLRLAKQYQDKNAALRQAQAEADKAKEKAEVQRRPITRHSLFR